MDRLGPFDGDRRVVVAVSGGADSMALAVLTAGWGRPLAAIVDHGLRAEAAAEAEATACRLEVLGIPSIIRNAGLRPGPAQAEHARVARYRLLLEICRESGRPDLLLGHHAGDQAETVRMRHEKASGPLGLAGMAPVAHRAEARLLRPLLGVDPNRLRAFLRTRAIDWFEDPSNADLRSGRGRLRAALSDADRAESLCLARDAAGICAASQPGRIENAASIALHPEGYALLRQEVGPELLSDLIRTVSGRTHPPHRRALRAGLAPRTVGGVLIRSAGRLGPGVLMMREPAGVATSMPAAAGSLWDGRFRIGGAVPAGLEIGALGGDASLFRARSPLPAAVLATLPALRRGASLWAVPHLRFPDEATCRSVRLEFWPNVPAVPFRFTHGVVNPSEGRGV